MNAPALLAELRTIVGTDGAIDDLALMGPYLTDWRNLFHGTALAVVRPADAAETSAVVRACAASGASIVPQGGNTGLAAGATPVDLTDAIVLSTSRMRAVRRVDPLGNTIEVEAGCVLADVRDVADRHDRLFPLSLGAEGSAQIGGLLATNAGGSGVLRYGTMRALTLGLEVVLPDGTIASGLRALRKDNAGYDWKQLFIGSEGTLGIVTAAVLRLFPKPAQRATAWLACESIEGVMATFVALRERLGEALDAAEMICEEAVALRVAQGHAAARPLAARPWYLLAEAASSIDGMRDAFEGAIAAALEAGVALDAVVASSPAQAAALWAWRESIPETEKRAGPSAKHDVAVPIAAIPAFVREATAAVAAAHSGARVLAFGHVGDGNVHFNVLLPDGVGAAAVNATVHALVARYQGSITAEHGVGRYRRSELPLHRSPAELALMRTIKRALDPNDTMNPGCVL